MIVGINGLWVLIAVVISLVLSKVFKLFYYKNAKDAMLAGGGMPSSHCASAMALTSMIFFIEGFSTTFALSLSFTAVVLTDAVRVRRAVGINAKALRDLVKQNHHRESIMVENGHTIPEAIYGCVLGLAVSVVTYIWVFL